ncbi:MAG TPA: RNA-guided endonuclease TnpB family protein [Verrucomicrobiae bacterium]|nr:RNA-guided endonuclease TnpB family protein [Verrucomicrobiae bacterium]
MILAHCVRLIPTLEQESYFRRACGVARFAYNWALVEWQRQYLEGAKPSEVALRRQLNAVKGRRFPWMLEVTKNTPQQAIKNLGRAYAYFFADLEKYRRKELPWKRVRVPRFKRKGQRDSFRADNGPDKSRPNAVLVDCARVRLPRVGWVRMREEVRFAGRILSVTVSRRADAWYASFAIEVDYEPDTRTDASLVGVDLGLESLATLSDGTKFAAPKPLRRYLKKLGRLSRRLARKRLGSRNRAKAKAKLARLHARIAAIRLDALHKLSSHLVRYAVIVIEELNVGGMLANRCLARAISDVGLSEFRRQLEYKATMAGSRLVVADRWFPSSKLCSSCYSKNESLSLSQRTWTCRSCGMTHDRDGNAAANLARYPESWAGSACGAEGAGGG